MYVDFRKAYDSVNRDALWKVLRLYGVHPKLITLLKDLHSSSAAAVRVGGELRQQLPVKAGVRQGDQCQEGTSHGCDGVLQTDMETSQAEGVV